MVSGSECRSDGGEEGPGGYWVYKGSWALGTDPASHFSLPPCPQFLVSYSESPEAMGASGPPASTCWSCLPEPFTPAEELWDSPCALCLPTPRAAGEER